MIIKVALGITGVAVLTFCGMLLVDHLNKPHAEWCRSHGYTVTDAPGGRSLGVVCLDDQRRMIIPE